MAYRSRYGRRSTRTRSYRSSSYRRTGYRKSTRTGTRRRASSNTVRLVIQHVQQPQTPLGMVAATPKKAKF